MRGRVSLFVCAFLAATTLCVAQTGATAKSKGTAAGAGSSDKMIVEKSRATWEAYKKRDVAAMKELTAEDYVSHTLEGPSNLKQDIDTISKLTIDAYSIDEPKVTWATKDVAILSYKCELKGSYEGKAFKPVYATEVWVNRGGKWRIVAYSETPK